jgi:hypothetical protein
MRKPRPTPKPTPYVFAQINTSGPIFRDGTRCWLWTGTVDKHGYGRASINGGSGYLVHRVIYADTYGPIEGVGLDHLCRRPSCVNPLHLEPVTQAENVRRGEAGRNMREKTHCPQGHPYEGVNLIRRRLKKGGFARVCRECQNEANRRYRQRKKVLA